MGAHTHICRCTHQTHRKQTVGVDGDDDDDDDPHSGVTDSSQGEGGTASPFRLSTCTSTRLRSCTHTFTHACTRVHTSIHLYEESHTDTHTCIHARTSLDTYKYVRTWRKMLPLMQGKLPPFYFNFVLQPTVARRKTGIYYCKKWRRLLV